MHEEPEFSGSVRLGVAAALSRGYAEDARAFLLFLAQLLEDSLPEDTEILRQGVFKKEVVGLAITLGADRYRFEHVGKGGVCASRAHIVRGISLKTEEIPVEQALTELADALETRVASNARARTALAGLLGLD